MARNIAILLVISATVLSSPARAVESQNRGIGIYPGDPAEDFSPSLVPAPSGRRNLALNRAATQSSAFDYNLAAQLVTDGIKETVLPRWLSVSTSFDGELPRHERQFVVDDNVVSGLEVDRPGWIGFEFGGGEEPFVVDRVEIGLVKRDWLPFGPPAVSPACLPGAWGPPVSEPDDDEQLEWSAAISEDGREWTEVGKGTATVPPPPPMPGIEVVKGKVFNWMVEANPPVWTSLALDEPTSVRRLRVQLDDLECKRWSVAEVRFYRSGERVHVGGPHQFGSAWKSAGLGEEWIAVDLGATAIVDSVALHWLLPPALGEVQVSVDGEDWTRVGTVSGAEGLEEISLSPPVEARHLRVMMRRPSSPVGYMLSELEVFGEGGLVAEAAAQPGPEASGSLHLAGGDWRLQRATQVEDDGEAVATVGFSTEDWIVATVPATVLTSYYNAGALADLNFGANELNISDSFFHSDFWYRNQFEGPRMATGQRAFLDFDGVNWKAHVYFNGEALGRVEGAFKRGRFDVTDLLRSGDANVVAIRIEKPATPGSAKQHTLETAGHNGGAIGADNPTYHASIGWDWIPTIRGRSIGLWNDVHLTVSGPVTIDDPYIRFTLPLPDTSSADLHLETGLTNHGSSAIEGTLRGVFGDIAFAQVVEIAAGSTEQVVLDPSTHSQLRLAQPRLWWPNGYGEPHLYDVELQFIIGDGVSDSKSFQSGVRQMTYAEEDEALHIFVNGRRIVPRGGNWGFPEANLRYRGREYETAMRYHRDMNFTMVRNWVGQTGDQEFYEAADRNGILIWQDFWLANPLDGPDPDDEALFMSNVEDTIRRIRNHPSVSLYCGRNEGHPPPTLDAGFATAIEELHPEIHYIPNSIYGTVSGGGPYGVRPREWYFIERATPKPHSELGMTSVVTLDSLKAMMPESGLWPMSQYWGLHDFNLESNQRAEDFVAMIDQAYGGTDDLARWVDIAQLVNYDGYRAMFEAQSENRMGLQLWMSHPAWPSLTWQTYDYYFNPHSAYFGSKKGSEQLHIQWHPVTDEVEVVNYGVPDASGLLARAQVLNLDGTVKWEKESAVDSDYDSTISPFPMEFPDGLTPVHFIRLFLMRGEETISENFYWRGTEVGNYRALRTLPEVELRETTRTEATDEGYLLRTEIENPSKSPALAVRLIAVGAETGERILPAIYSDNFVPLMPGEKRTIETELLLADTRGEEPRIVIEGFNVAPSGE